MKEKLEVLLSELAKTYEISDIRTECLKNNLAWHYSLVTTAFEIHMPLIVGFNWGATENVSYEPQKNIDKANFLNEDLGSLRRAEAFFSRHLGPNQIESASQTNFCFFRSHKESQISKHDILLCQPIFERLIGILQPSYIICFSVQLKKSLLKLNLLENIKAQEIKWESGAREITYSACKAYFKGIGEIYFLPHPNYPLSGTAREKAWEFCFGKG